MIPEATSDLLTTKETLARLGVVRTTLYRFMRKGRLPRYKVGGTLRFREADVTRLAQELHPPKKREDFEIIYWPDGSCGVGQCDGYGVVLAYDPFSPEIATWLCHECWPDFEMLMSVVEDHRTRQAKEQEDA